MDLVKAENVSVPFQGMTALPIIRQLGLLIGLAASIARRSDCLVDENT